MKRLFLLLTTCFLVFSFGCADISDIGEWGDENGEQNKPEEKPITELSAIAAEDIVVGFISDSAEDDCYTRLCENALRETLVEIGATEQNFKTMYNVSSGYECERVSQILISLGCNVIVSAGDDLGDSLKKAAKANPEVYFIASGSGKYGDNMSLYSIDTAELHYLFGAILGVLSDTQRIGYVASLYSERVSDINAFALGAMKTNPGLTVDVAFSDKLDIEYAELVIGQFSVGGCDLLVCHGGSEILREALAETSMSVFDLCIGETESYFPEITYNIQDIFLPFFEMIVNGEWKATDYRLSVSDGQITVDISNGRFSEDDALLLYEIIEDALSEDFNIFEGEIKNNRGEIEIKAGETLLDSDIEKMDFLVFGIVGTLPEEGYPRSAVMQSEE